MNRKITIYCNKIIINKNRMSNVKKLDKRIKQIVNNKQNIMQIQDSIKILKYKLIILIQIKSNDNL